ncbi:MAG TPA: ABC transporter substrate-binding protein [Candidatus Sulfotelmatobacter sp.]|jgi:ABC-type branched-subunit amino acid transport system substrate-binding protein|nr:ABC transporter substrate-binding protein [Candidatus Sulfotelmatobacter sp.]
MNQRSPVYFPVRAVLFLLLALASTMAGAETPGVTENSILIGSCSALDGPARFLGNQTVLGATTYLHSINDEGGVFGRKLQLLAFDDGYDPDKAPACFKRMTKEGVFALGFFVGTPTAKVYVPLAQDEKIPVVGLFTGAQMLYEPLKHYVVNVRASYYDETREQVDKLWEANIRKIGVIYQDDAFGKTVLDGLKLALQKHNSAPAATGAFPRNTLDVEEGLKSVMAARPQAVVVVGPYAPVAAIVKQAHAAGWRPQFLTVSFVGTEEFIKEAGPDAEGTIITQVVPPYDRTDYPTVALYRKYLARYYPDASPSFVSLEGFVDAMVMVEGLKRAGKNVTREKFISGIESIHELNVGLGSKLVLAYGPKDHKGFDDVYSTVVKNGRPELLTNWSTIGK